VGEHISGDLLEIKVKLYRCGEDQDPTVDWSPN
jgi:hypothetical protein